LRHASLSLSWFQHGLDCDRCAVIVLFLLSLFFRLFRLSTLDVWFDEVAVLLQTQMSFSAIWDLCKTENFPPLYPWLLKLWGLLGTSDPWMRLFSAFTGSLVPPFAYLLGRELHDRRLGLLLALACMLSLPLYYYSQVIRMYSQFALFSCLSYFCFLRALRHNEWKYWLLTALFNLLNFYTFLFACFVIAAEFFVLVWHYRFHFRAYLRPMLSHLPAFGLMSFWLLTLMTRYQVQQAVWEEPLRTKNLISLWIYFGTGAGFGSRYFLTILFNLPFLLGVVIGARSWFEHRPLLLAAFLGGISLILVCTLSVFGHSMLSNRYMIFILPLYLALAISGWLSLRRTVCRILGIAWIFAALLFSHVYYLTHYIQVNDTFRHQGGFISSPDDDGRSMSRMAALIQQQLGSDEVIIHYSGSIQGHLSYFPFLHYHQGSLPEYLYSAQEIPHYAGRQYLRPGEWIRALTDLGSRPKGIWVITLSKPDFAIYGSPLYESVARLLASKGDLAKELYDCGYRHQETFRDGSVSALHFRLGTGS